jgi:hypothetical protein
MTFCGGHHIEHVALHQQAPELHHERERWHHHIFLVP